VSDTYSAADAARVLGVSERLVRKMAQDGRVTVVSTGPLRVSQESVHQQRSKRPRKPKPEPQPQITAADLQALAERVAAETAVRVAEQITARMLETRDQVEQRQAAELARAQQEIQRLQQELEQVRSQPALRLPPIGWPFRR
jgi:hypothetical protein